MNPRFTKMAVSNPPAEIPAAAPAVADCADCYPGAQEQMQALGADDTSVVTDILGQTAGNSLTSVLGNVQGISQSAATAYSFYQKYSTEIKIGACVVFALWVTDMASASMVHIRELKKKGLSDCTEVNN